ncbi:hypothetical protein M422DRAFT_273249 [Sphaerobolus stellatus SS14]|uniref:Uncharacterized protein n=1 Tax=Sphaerobolus stellatus (strain SS14) TaxID=990650 RepID=A0A0C9T9Q2_SPHS4|nr:hypothetical protein M422DRAFT_273249 [Sphaerobolus stellatus SS14]
MGFYDWNQATEHVRDHLQASNFKCACGLLFTLLKNAKRHASARKNSSRRRTSANSSR